jgi:hypothetical protein
MVCVELWIFIDRKEISRIKVELPALVYDDSEIYRIC